MPQRGRDLGLDAASGRRASGARAGRADNDPTQSVRRLDTSMPPGAQAFDAIPVARSTAAISSWTWNGLLW